MHFSDTKISVDGLLLVDETKISPIQDRVKEYSVLFYAERSGVNIYLRLFRKLTNRSM